MSRPRRLRSYALTGGRTVTDASLSMETLLVAEPAERTVLSPEQQQIHAACDEPQSIVDLSSRMRLPLGVLRVLITDLLGLGHLRHSQRATTQEAAPAAHEDLGVLGELLDGIEAL